jgi:hypothetical protein
MITVLLMRAARIGATLILLAGFLGPMMPQAAGADPMTRQQIERRLAEWILSRVPAYEKSSQGRVLVACIDWEGATPDSIPVRGVSSCQTAEGSDRLIFTSKLMNCAMQECTRRKGGNECECVPVATNMSPVLRLPDAVFEQLLRHPTMELVDCLLPGGGLPVSTRLEACHTSGGRALSKEEAQRLREAVSLGVAPPTMEFVDCLLPVGGLPVSTRPEACHTSGGRVLSKEEAQQLREEF